MFRYEISYPDFEPLERIKVTIKKQLEKLERLFQGIINCHVFVRSPHSHSKKPIFHIQIHLEIPGYDLYINREAQKDYAHQDINIAIRDAFNALKRQLRERRKTMIKHHPGPTTKKLNEAYEPPTLDKKNEE